MRKVVVMAATAGLMLAASSVAYARGGHGFGGFGAGGPHGFGASAYSPGHMFRAPDAQPQPGYPGASYYAPGRQMQMNGGPYMDQSTGQYYPGATYWTPPSRMLRGN